MKIIPAIDILGGKCVRLTRGDYQQVSYYREDPLDMALALQDAGFQYLHIADLDGAKLRTPVNLKILERIAAATYLQIDFGGGLLNATHVQQALDAGASQVTLGSIAAEEPELFLACLQQFGPDTLLLGADARNRKVAVSGWTRDTGQDVLAFIDQYARSGVKYAVCTDISRDGMLQGPAFALYQEILEQTDIKLIASGGVSAISDVIQLKAMGCHGVIIGKALYEGTIQWKELTNLC